MTDKHYVGDANHIYRDKRVVSVGTTDTPLLGPNKKRVGVIISCPSTNRITIDFGIPAVLDQALTMYPSGQPVQLFVRDWGDAIKEEIRAISAIATQNVTIFDLFTA
jgi:hypothetical protein